MGTASLTFGSISVTIILKTVSESKTVTPEKKSRRLMMMLLSEEVEVEEKVEGLSSTQLKKNIKSRSEI